MIHNVINNVFNKGQLTPWLDARTKTDAHAGGAKSLLNCTVRPFGGAMRRPGLIYINATKTTGVTRILPFSASIEDTYLIEMGIGYFRFYKDGAIIETSPGVPYELANTFIEADIDKITFVQSNDVMFMAVNTLHPKKLSRISDTNWTFTNLDFQDGPFLAENTSSVTLTPSAVTGAITLTASSATFTSDMVGAFFSVNTKKTVDDVLVQGVVQITAFSSSTAVSANVTKELVNTDATTIWAEGAWSNERGFPGAISFSDSRLWFANCPADTQKAWGSEVFVYNQFDVEESVSIEIPSNKLNSINSLINGRDLSAFTLGGNFIINSGTNREAITGENIVSSQQGNVGSAVVQAARIGNSVFYPQRAGEKLMEFRYSWEDEGYVTNEISMFSEEVLESGIKQMAVQETEDTILYCVLNNGKIAALTREASQNVSALSPLETDGEFVSVASLPNDSQFWDDTYVIVQREIDGSTVQYIELFGKPRRTDLTTGVFCDCAKIYDEVGGITTLTGLGHLEGETVQILRDGAVEPTDVVSGGEIVLKKEGFNVIVGLPYRSEVQPMNDEQDTKTIGNTQGQLRRKISASLKLIDTMGIKIEGGDFDESVFVRRFDIKMGTPNPLFTGDVKVNVAGNSEVTTEIKVIQENPLPMNVIGISTRISVQEE